MTKNQTYKVFQIEADYRPLNPNKPHYYVLAKTKKAAKKRFEEVITWLDIYGITTCDEALATEVIANPYRYILLKT